MESTTHTRVRKVTIPKIKKLAKKLTKEEKRNVSQAEAMDIAVTQKLETPTP